MALMERGAVPTSTNRTYDAEEINGMASLYKKPVVMTDPKSGKRVKTKSKKWWGRYRDENGVERRVPLATDKAAAQAMLSEAVKKAERQGAGLIDPSDDQRKRPLCEHLAEFKRYLKNKGVTPKQVHTASAQFHCIINDRKWKMVGDITASGALEFLGGLRDAGKSAQTYNHYLKSAKQFTRWLVRDGRALVDPLAHVSKLNVSMDRRHDRRALTTEEFSLLVDAAHHGKVIECIPGPDRAMMYVLAAWTGFRKGEIGSLSLRSFQLDSEPATATVAACYSKRKRQDSQILHSEVVRRLKEWLATKSGLNVDDILFPVSGRVPGGTERKTHKMMQLDLKAARTNWLMNSKTTQEQKSRAETDFLSYENDEGLFADFHSNRHLFITSLERGGLSPKMAQTLARHSDVRLTLGIYTHVGLHDQTRAIESLPAPPKIGVGPQSEAPALAATGTHGAESQLRAENRSSSEVPAVVPRGAENGAVVLAPNRLRITPDCIHETRERNENGDPKIAVNSDVIGTYRTDLIRSASTCKMESHGRTEVSPARFELATFGFGGRRSIQLSYGDKTGRPATGPQGGIVASRGSDFQVTRASPPELPATKSVETEDFLVDVLR